MTNTRSRPEPGQRLKTQPTIASNSTFTPAKTVDGLITRLGTLVALYDQAVEELTRHELTQDDVDLITPPRTHIQLAINNLDNALFEVDHHGKSYPQGKPRLRLAGDTPHGITARKPAQTA